MNKPARDSAENAPEATQDEGPEGKAASLQTSADAPSGKPSDAPKKGDSKAPGAGDGETAWDRWKANLRTIGGAVALALFIRIVLFEAFEIEGPSMEPTLLNGDRVVVAKFLYGLFLPFTREAVVSWGMPNPGDVVIVKSPQDDIDIVKRVIGLPGDVIEIREDVVYRNGIALAREEVGPCTPDAEMQSVADCVWVDETVGGVKHRSSHSMTSPPFDMQSVRVPPGNLFILGDHRDRSNDSRFFGPVPIGRVKGRALAIYWSNGNEGVRGSRIFMSVQ